MANGQQMGGFLSGPTPTEARQARRERLFSQFAAGARSGGPGATLGAGIGTLISGLFGQQPGVDRGARLANARRQITEKYGGVQGIINAPSRSQRIAQVIKERGLDDNPRVRQALEQSGGNPDAIRDALFAEADSMQAENQKKAGAFLGAGPIPEEERRRLLEMNRKISNLRDLGARIDQVRSPLEDAQLILSRQGLHREAQQLPFEVQQYRLNEAKMAPQAAEPELKNYARPDGQGGFENYQRVDENSKKAERLRQAGYIDVGRNFPDGGGASTQTEREVNRLMERGFTRADAQDIAFGYADVSRNPLTGEATIINLATGEQRPVRKTDQGDQDSVAPVSQKQGLLDDQLEVGLVPWLQEGVSRTFGQFFDSANNPSVTRARTKLRSAQQQLLSALAVSGRPPVIEQERIINNLPSLGPFESPDRATTQLNTLLDDLMVQRRADKQAIDNENLNPSLRKELQGRVNAVDRMIRVIDPSRLSGKKESSAQSQEEVVDETPTLETLRNNAEDTRTVDGRTFYFYKGQWWAE